MYFTNTPEPPYYAVIFTSKKNNKDVKRYNFAANLMVELASEQDGFLGVESVREENGLGITISYWDSLDSIKLWKENIAHKKIQEKGKKDWYDSYSTRICKVEKAYTNNN